ncbi:hypothetical protein LCGC14_1675120 [marine sediment metagenome]|uniref:DNA methylase N-4/N-6 domain-containing protein n=1 Tax=marine sediment metagenome TaxID=412755 RepID=A0A0F9KQ44_9ZZZZ
MLNRSGHYEKCDDNLPYSDYLDWLMEVFTEVYRVTVPGGRCFINIDAMTNRQEDRDREYIRAIYPHLYNIMVEEIGWKFRTEICWLKREAVGKKTAWGSWLSASNPIIRRNHEYIIGFSKGDWKLESEIPSDLTKKEFEKYTLSTWNVQPETKKRAGHPAPFSEELCKRVIKLFSFPGQIVLDPFSGTGTTCYMSYILGRDYIGIDNSKKYCEYAENRIDTAEQQRELYQEMLQEELKNQKTKRQRQKEKEDKLKENEIFE